MLRERLGEHATFLGWLEGDELARAYASADLFLFASRTDTFGQVLLEAQASGLPVVAVDEGGPTSIVTDGVTGRLCPADAARAGRRRVRARRRSRCSASALARSALRGGRGGGRGSASLQRLADGYRRALDPVARRRGVSQPCRGGAEAARAGAASPAPLPRLRLVEPAPLRVVDVALVYGSRRGAVGSHLQRKAAWARESAAIDHHVVVPGRVPGHTYAGRRRELASLRLALPRGYRVTLGLDPLEAALRALRPEVVLLHGSFSATPPDRARIARNRRRCRGGSSRSAAVAGCRASLAPGDPRVDSAPRSRRRRRHLRCRAVR